MFQLWKLNQKQTLLSFRAFISVTGIFWRLKWLDFRLNLRNPFVQFFIGASSAGYLSLTAIDISEVEGLEESSAIKYEEIQLVQRVDAGQCLCFDVQNLSQNRTRIMAGFSNGTVAMWVLKNSDVILRDNESTAIVPSMVFTAHLSCVNNIVWNVHNVDHFATSSNAIEDSLKASLLNSKAC